MRVRMIRRIKIEKEGSRGLSMRNTHSNAGPVAQMNDLGEWRRQAREKLCFAARIRTRADEWA
jgi:hypothetical protein